MKVYTKAGDDGTTGLLYGGRVAKDSPRPVAYGSVDEAQAAIGLARAECVPGDELDRILVGLCRDLYVAMAELATAAANRVKLVPGRTLVTASMVEALEQRIDGIAARFAPPTDFVIPGATRTAAALDLARTVVRRAERDALAVTVAAADDGESGVPPSRVGPFLNRLSDLLWVLARWQEGESILAREADRADG